MKFNMCSFFVNECEIPVTKFHVKNLWKKSRMTIEKVTSRSHKKNQKIFSKLIWNVKCLSSHGIRWRFFFLLMLLTLSDKLRLALDNEVFTYTLAFIPYCRIIGIDPPTPESCDLCYLVLIFFLPQFQKL